MNRRPLYYFCRWVCYSGCHTRTAKRKKEKGKKKSNNNLTLESAILHHYFRAISLDVRTTLNQQQMIDKNSWHCNSSDVLPWVSHSDCCQKNWEFNSSVDCTHQVFKNRWFTPPHQQLNIFITSLHLITQQHVVSCWVHNTSSHPQKRTPTCSKVSSRETWVIMLQNYAKIVLLGQIFIASFVNCDIINLEMYITITIREFHKDVRRIRSLLHSILIA